MPLISSLGTLGRSSNTHSQSGRRNILLPSPKTEPESSFDIAFALTDREFWTGNFASAPAIMAEPDWSQVQVNLYPDSPWLTKPPTEKDLVFHASEAATFTLRKTSAYQRGYVYTTPYYLASKDADHTRMMRVVVPPQLFPRLDEGKFAHDPVPNCVQMVPGVPFAYEIEGHADELHTIGAVHTFESLRHETDFWEIYNDTVLVAKGLRGCRPAGNTDEVFPITHYPIKPNDRSPTDLPPGSKEGSYNLANTLLKGIGQGVVLPAAQVDTPEFSGQVSTVLQCLSRLRRRLLRKTLSKYEYDATEFNSEDMNVVGYGGLEPNNATSCQVNLSGNWRAIAKTLGISGSPHPDSHDEDTRKTHVVAFFDLPPDSDPGAFLFARAGLFLRELNTWALHILFDGTDIHAGVGSETTLSIPEFKQWVETELETAWNHSEIGRMVVVQYAMRSAHNRNTHMSMMPSIRFGNIGPELPTGLRDFATHGEEILGGQEPWANRMGREIIYGFWNQLQQCNLDLDCDIDDLMQNIMFKNSAGDHVHLKPLPFHPIKDAEMVARKRGHFEYLRQRCLKMRIYIEKWRFIQFRQALAGDNYDPDEDQNFLSMQWPSRSSISTKSNQNPTASVSPDFHGKVVKILDQIRCCYRVLTDDERATSQLIQQNDLRLPAEMVKKFMATEVAKVSSVPILEHQIAETAVEDVEMLYAGTSANQTEEINESTHAPADGDTSDLSPSNAGVGGGAGMDSAPSLRTDSPNLTLEKAVLPEGAAGCESQNPVNLVRADSAAPLRTDSSNVVQTNSLSDGAGAESSQSSALQETPDEQEFDVEKIFEVEDDSDGTWYLCKFMGYEEKEWVHVNDMSIQCDTLLKDFYASLAAENSSSESRSTDSSESDAESSRPKRKKRKLVKAKSSQKGLPKSAPLVAVSLDHTEHLATLLNVDRLAMEVEKVREGRPTHGRASKLFFTALVSPTLIPNILDTCYAQSQKLTTLEHIIDNRQSSKLTIATAEFTKLMSSAATISQVTAFEQVTSLLTRILRWTSARAHIVIYRWCASIGPSTIKHLFDVHRAEGFEGFRGNRPLGLVVDHIVQHVCEAMKSNYPNSSLSHGPFGSPVLGDLTHIPGALYGLLETGGKRNIPTIKLPNPGRVNLYAACQTCLLEVLQKAIIMPSLRACKDMYASTNNRSRTASDDSMFSRAICRGAVLDCIVDVCEDEGILSSDAVDTVIDSPWLSFPLSRSDRVGPALLNRAEITLAPLKDWLSARLQVNPTIREYSYELGNEIHTVLLEMSAGEPHPDTVEHLNEVAAAKALARAPKSSAPKSSAPKSSVRKTRTTSYARPDIDVIVPLGTAPKFVLPGLIIREALNLHRNLAPGNIHLRRLLQGHHATQSMAGPSTIGLRNPDHLDPRREFNRYTALFQAHFTPSQLTTPQGLSNVLSWFGTGQGVPTESFLDSLIPTGGFFKDDAAGMVQQFQIIISRNQMGGAPVQYDNSQAWSRQPNQALLAQPTKIDSTKKAKGPAVFGGKRKRKVAKKPKEQYTLLEKLGPNYADTVQERWTAHLGVLAGKDPTKARTEDLPSWSSTLKLVTDLETAAFKTGLTAMQLVNTLVFSKVVRMPTVMEMADWIAINPKLGAVTGLDFLGFRTSTRDQIRASYITFHYVLEKFLTLEDRDLLGFHPPFTEHLLCKTPRWDKLLADDKSATLLQIAAQLGIVLWNPGENLTDPSSLPLPVIVKREDLELALKTEETRAEEFESPLNGNDERNVAKTNFIQGSSRTGRVIVPEMNEI
ncbi:hypothetical protein B0H19DRAFT_1080594 [Mycena capillaripes]|nr:hypothetical protein B0H19DRAFT_1080594 [Mycena capillaripes]